MLLGMDGGIETIYSSGLNEGFRSKFRECYSTATSKRLESTTAKGCDNKNQNEDKCSNQ